MTRHAGDTVVTCANPRCGVMFTWHAGTPVSVATRGKKRRGIYCPRCSTLMRQLYRGEK